MGGALGVVVLAIGVIGGARKVANLTRHNDPHFLERTSSHRCKDLSGDDLRTCVRTVIAIQPYRYSAYKQAVESVDKDALEGGSEVQTPDALVASVLELLADNDMDQYAPYLEAALQSVKIVNRYPFLEDELTTGTIWMTMGMKIELMVLMVVLSELQGGENLNVVFAGCGLGDWAIETALVMGADSKVWCFNRLSRVTNMSQDIIRGEEVGTLFDRSVMADTLWNKAKEVQAGVNFGWACSEPWRSECVLDGLLTYELDRATTKLGGNFDAAIFGNSLKPAELQSVRASLKRGGFTLVPVCTESPRRGGPGGAAWYCAGRWWKLREDAGKDDEGLWRFSSIMRPIGANSDALSSSEAQAWN